MKRYANILSVLLGLYGMLMLLPSAKAQLSLPFYEPFPGTNDPFNGLGYANNEELGASGTGASGTIWTFGNSVSGSSSRIATNANLTYPGLTNIDAIFATYGLQSHVASTSSKNRAVLLALPTNGSIFASCLVNFQNFIPVTTAMWGLSPTTTGTSVSANGAVVYYDSGGHLHVAKNSGTPATATTLPLATNTTHFVVLRYKYNPGGNDQVDLWLDPVSLGNDSAVPSPSITTTNNANVPTFASIAYFETSGPALFNLDEIRVATNWSGVTPTTPPPGHIFGLTGGGTGCPGDAFPINVAGSDSGVSYLLYTNGVFANESVDGTGNAISFPAQTTTALYSVLASNTVTANVGWMTNTVAITVLQGPVFTTEPTSITVANNGQATFVTAATGQGLHFQWFKNGVALADGGHISGSTTPDLTIFPATSADAATVANGYSLVITNSCGLAATSSVVALTIDTAANLFWAGSSTNTNWDLGITPNFNTDDSGVGSLVFNSGDNVTFDTGGGAAPTVNLVGSFLTAGVVTIGGGAAYAFSGPGSIAGPASLVVNGSTLTVSNVNTYTGGTILTNGGLAVMRAANFESFGTAPIKMAGGTLEIPIVGSALLGLTNDLDVQADSTLQYDATGSFGTVIFGALSGLPGTTLTVETQQTPSTPSRVRFYNTNFVENGNINIGSSFTQFAPYNGSGSQVYNGVISGGGTIITRNAGATNFFNGANTFNGPSGPSTLLTAGGVGLGINSVSSTPPTVDSGPLGIGAISLQTDGSGGTANATLLASGGARILHNPFTYAGTGTIYTLNIAGTNDLTLAGEFSLQGQDGTGETNRLLDVDNAGLTTITGVIDDAGLTCGIIKSGSGVLALAATNTYTGSTTVSNGTLLVNGQVGSGGATAENGTLGGSGVIGGPVTIDSGASLAPGNQGIGTLTISDALTLSSGSTTRVEVNKSAGTSDLVTGLTSVTYAGTLNATNIAGTPNVGDTFTLFSAAAHSGNFTTIAGTPGSGKAWSFNPTNGVLSVISGGTTIATNATNISFAISASGTSLNLKWPPDHLGWTLQTQTNSTTVGLSTNWVTVDGSTAVTNETIQVNTNGSQAVFFRLIGP